MQVRPLTIADAEEIATWRYPGRSFVYDIGEPVSSEEGYRAVERDGGLVGYCCFGAEARVAGVDAEEGTLDVGYGMRPDLVGHGLGRGFVAAILDAGLAEFEPSRLRLLILEWNQPSRRVAEALGFRPESTVSNDQGTFVVMRRATPDTTPSRKSSGSRRRGLPDPLGEPPARVAEFRWSPATSRGGSTPPGPEVDQE